MKTHLIPCLKITILTMLLFGVGYPLLITGIAKIMAPNGGEGGVIELNGAVVGFEVIGQSFKSDRYFNGRPSAVGYNAAATGGSNKGPSNPDYLAEVNNRIQDFLSRNPETEKQDLSVDLITASGGGLDPHISPAAASVQVARISKLRGVSEASIQQLILQNTRPPLFGMFGNATVHVLHLNIALDSIK